MPINIPPLFNNIPDSLPLLKPPKLEPSLALALEYDTSSTSIPTLFSHSHPPLPDFNLIPPTTNTTTDSLLFNSNLPDLLSLDSPSSSSSAAPKRRRFSSDPEEAASSSSSASAAVMVPRSSALARQRRQKLGDKTRCLQKLLPWDKKMSTTTMLEDTYKYVKFLQAQLASLQAMPSHGADQHHHRHNLGSFGVLGRLNRNQVLQVLVNSPVAQTLLSSQGRCVFSVEQLEMQIAKKTTTTPASLLSTSNLF